MLDKIMDWCITLAFPFYIDNGLSTVAWVWHGGYGKPDVMEFDTGFHSVL